MLAPATETCTTSVMLRNEGLIFSSGFTISCESRCFTMRFRNLRLVYVGNKIIFVSFTCCRQISLLMVWGVGHE